MAGNKNPWRDVYPPAEWATILASSARAPARGVVIGARPARTSWVVATSHSAAVTTPAEAITTITRELGSYDAIAKDNHALFDTRRMKLKVIGHLCNRYLTLLGTGHVLGAKGFGAHKQLTDQLDLWVTSLGKRALKKAEYLETMRVWHLNAKLKYKNLAAMYNYLLRLENNVRSTGEMLHATAYATMEKIDPYRRQTFVFPDLINDRFNPVNEMGTALVAYLTGQPASNPDRATNADPSFYEWLEYHPYCIGTPGVSGDARYKDPNRVKYEGHDLGYAYMTMGQIQYTRLVSDPGGRYILNTTDFPASGKGPPGAVAFVWDRDSNLLLHEHGSHGFVHASAKAGKKVRCSGMLTASGGTVDIITNQSGHYAPNAKSIYYFADWLKKRNCLAANAVVTLENDIAVGDGDYDADNYIDWGLRTYGPPPVTQYHQ